MSSKIKSIEQEKGKSIQDILIELYETHGNLYAIADELGTSQGTISLWIMKHGLEFKTTLVKKSA